MESESIWTPARRHKKKGRLLLLITLNSNKWFETHNPKWHCSSSVRV
jgi:hypothetical protein